MPASDMIYTDNPDGSPHEATVGEAPKQEFRQAQLSGEAFGDGPELGYKAPRHTELPGSHDHNPDA